LQDALLVPQILLLLLEVRILENLVPGDSARLVNRQHFFKQRFHAGADFRELGEFEVAQFEFLDQTLYSGHFLAVEKRVHAINHLKEDDSHGKNVAFR